MNKLKLQQIGIIFLNLILGGMLLYGGVAKFSKPIPEPNAMIEQFKKGEVIGLENTELKIKNYIFGMKQTNYFWQFLGFSELLAGLLLVSQLFARIGAFIAMPVTINIFLFHLFLEPHEMGELIQMTVLLIVNLLLIASSFTIWKPLLINKNFIKP